MNKHIEQAGFSENETQPLAATNRDSIGSGVRLEEVEDDNVWEAYNRWRTPHE